MSPDPAAELAPTVVTPVGSVKLGRVATAAPPPALRLARYLDPAAAPPPAKVDYYTKAKPSLDRMYLNDRLGCCVISGKFHQIGLYTANDAPFKCVTVPDGLIQEYYQKLKAGPGDSGCIITDVLDYWVRTGFKAVGDDFQPVAYKLDGYVRVNPADRTEVKVASYLFGSLTLGIDIPDSWVANARPGFVWRPTNSRITGGHDVCTVGYDAVGVQVSTWGAVGTIAWEAMHPRWIQECYAQLSPNWYGDDRLAPSGVAAAKLASDLKLIGQGGLPEIPDPPEPAPDPNQSDLHWII